MIESENSHEPDRDAVLLQTSPDPENAGFGIIDCGATETVGSLPALESLMQARLQLSGVTEEVGVSAAPPKGFKFGNGTFSMSSSCVLVPQSIGDLQLRLQLYTLDCEGVPILIGMRTLRRLKAVVDFSKCLAIFVAVNPNLAAPLRRSKTGHLLTDLRGDWMQQGFRMDDIPPHLRLGDEQEEENFVASVYGKFPDCESQPGEPLSECAEHACPQPSAASNVSADSRVYHGEPAAQSSSDMKASLGALASLVALHFHGRDTAFAIEPPPKASAPKVSASKAKTKKPSPVERDLDWPRAERADPKDPRTLGPPCNGLHQEALPGRGSPSGANGHAMWRACRVCGLRILYVPRIGAHGLSRKAGPLSADTAQAVKELGSFRTSALGYAPSRQL